MNNEVEKYANTLSNNIVKELKKIDKRKINDKFDIIINDLSNNDKDEVLMLIINKQLNELKDKITVKSFTNKLKNKVVDLTDYYNTSCDSVIPELDGITDELLINVVNNSKLLTININDIKKDCLFYVGNDKIYDSLIWITLRLLTINYCISKIK